MRQILVMMAAVVLVGCGNKTPETSQSVEAEAQVASKPTPEPTPVSPADEKLIVEKAVRKKLKKPEGELTEADLENVTALWLGGTKITDAGLKDVAKVQQLRYLYLFDTKITDAGLKDVAKLQKLIYLDLSDTQITDESIKQIAKLQQLKELNLMNTKITDAGVAELKKALPNCKIKGP